MKNRAKLRLMRIFCLILLFSLANQANAGNLYRCLGEDGIPNYTNKKVPGSVCKVVAQSNSTPTPVSVTKAPTVVAQPAAVTPVSTEGMTATAATAPKVLETPAAKPSAAAPAAPKFLRMGRSTTYAYIDENGIKNFSSRKPKGVANVVATSIEYPIFSQPNCFACGIGTSINFRSLQLNTLAYATEIKNASKNYGVEEAVIRAIIHAESAYRPHVQSNKGAQGLMQLIPGTARRFGVVDAFDPAQNIDGGVQYLAWLLKRYGQDTTLAAAAYNAGEGAVDKYGGVPPYKETQNYVARVGQLAERYRKAL
jgi:soluble lytic murein transglycosylase-like protein